MKYIDTKDIDGLPGRRIGSDDTFNFRCHPDIGCFNRCCRNLNLFLYPYDVIRLKNRLELTSEDFLDRHVDVVLRDSTFFPDVLLSMSDNPEKTCPFLSDSGCLVYPDRPDACRTFPLEQGALYNARAKKIEPVYFFRPPDFCMGQHEETRWTPEAWERDQDARLYHKMTLLWSDLRRLFQDDPWRGEGPGGPRGKMAFMAIYNTDGFRNFIFKSTFLKRYKVKSAALKKLRADDVALMKFGFEWIRFYLWGLQGRHIRLR
ncbi:MAG: YkgJ family cysteine cluster protein [Deltaproteobacteria bacterium]|nr:YkgJ family cysteine cluster protein [Deltaproteobacteria bacterium]